jgi:hypothetical protein
LSSVPLTIGSDESATGGSQTKGTESDTSIAQRVGLDAFVSRHCTAASNWSGRQDSDDARPLALR